MAMIKEYLDYAELAQASYVDGLKVGMFGSGYVVDGKNIFVKEDEFSLKQAENFADRYEVKAVADSLVTGLDAVLFYDTIDSKYVLSIRGSTSYADYVSDVILATTGVAYGQLMALNDFYSEWVLDGTIPIGAKLDVTGHSLGGALAQMFSAIHPNGVENTYSYNAPGIGGLTTDAYNILGIDPQNALFLNITNIYAKEGPEATAGLGTMLGSVVPVSIDEDWALGNHRMGHLTESLYMHNMLSEITGEQNLNSLTSILEKVSNERVIQIVDDVFLDQQSALGIIDQAIALTDNNQGKATGLTNLTNKSASELNSREKSNLYALLNSNPFAIQGNLPAYTDINPSDYSDMYMSDRADYLYYILDKDARYGDGSGKDSYKAFDSYGTSLSGKTGNQVIFGTDNYNNDIQMSGDIGNDRIYGLGGDDELVGKEGNDILDAGTGNDTLIGGIDKESSDDETDILIGGEGDDTYYAGNGDIIEDSDATGEIYFHNESLKDIIATNTTENPNVYKSVNYTFTKSGDDLIVVDETINKEFIIKNFLLNGKQDESSYSAIGITLEDDTVNEIGKKYKEVSTQEDYDKYIALGYEVKWSGDNTFNATDRDDTINVGVGNDTAYGGAGDDFFSSTDGNDYFYGEDGKDIIKVAGNNNYIDGGAHSDTISTGNNSTVFGGSGADHITVLNNSTVDAGDGADTIVAGNDAVIDAGAHRDNITAGNNANINSGSGSDNVIAGDNATIINISGNDIIKAGDYTTFIGSDWSESIEVANFSLLENLGGGNDTVIAKDHNTIVVDSGDNNISIGSSNELLLSGGSNVAELSNGYASSNNKITASGTTQVYVSAYAANSNNIQTGASDDTFEINTYSIHSFSSNIVNLGDGNNTIISSSTTAFNNNSFITGSGDDVVNLGNSSVTHINDSSKNNYFNFGDGNNNVTLGFNKTSGNKIITGSGNDILHVKLFNDKMRSYVPVDERDVTDTGAGNDTIVFDSIYGILHAGAGDDTISVRNTSNVIYAGAGNDTIEFLDSTAVEVNNNSYNYLYYGVGDGKDTVVDHTGFNRIVFQGLTTKDLIVQKATDRKFMIGLREEGKEFSELSNTLSYDYSTTEPGHGASLFLSTGNQLEQGLSSVGYEIATRAFATVTAKDDNIVVYRNNSTILNPLSNDIDGAGSYGDGFSIKITSEPMYGQVIVNDDNTLTYIPNENQFGVDTIIYVATNLDGREDTGTITLDHIDNAAPITSDDNIATSSNKAVIIDVLANDTDQDGDQLSISITSSPRYGTVTVTKDNQVVYTPYDNYFGEDSFSYIALDDKEGVSNEATVAIIVNNSLAAAVIDSSEGSFINPSISRVNDNLFVTTWSSYSEEAVKVQLFNGQGEKIGEPFIANTTKDAFYDLKSYVIPLSNGEFIVKYFVEGGAGEFIGQQRFNSNGEKIGEEEILCDQFGDDVEYFLEEKATFNTIQKSITFDDGSNIEIYIANDKVLAQRYDVNLNKVDFIQSEVIINQVPIVIEAESNVLLQDVREQSGDIGATDEDGDTLTYTVSTDVQHGTLSIDENGTWTYNVEGTYMGEDTAIITVDDGNGGSVTKTLNFDSKVSTPTLSDSTNELLEDNSSNGIFNVVNPVGGVLTYEVVNQTTNGAFSVESDGTYNYNPSQDYNGTDAVTIKVTNQYGLSTTSTLTFDIEAVNDAPTVQSIDTTNLLEDSILITGQINANDVDNNSVLSYTAATIAGFTLNDDGSYSFDASNEAYQHLADGALETVTIPVTITDEHSASVTTDIVFEITGTNDKPLIADITAINTAEDASLVTGNITSTDVDDNSTATYSITDSVAGFILNIDGSYSFNPADEAYQSLAKDEIQEITIAVTVTDDKDATDTKDLVIRVVGTNDAPTVLNANESFTLQNIRNIDGQVEASDIDGDTLNYSVLTDAQNGIVTVDENGNWHYKADASFNGNDTATILVDDGNGGSVTSILNFTVDGYIYKGGDLVIDEASGNDTLSMSNINKDSLSFTRTSDDLQITVIDEGIITIKNYFINTQAGVESLQTAQGDINLSRDVINDVTSGWWCSSFIVRDTQDNLISGTESSDYIRGNSGDDIIFGNSRYDYISGRDGNDLLVGGSERDYLFGGRGDDNLYGDSGNDRLFGGRGNDALIGATGNDRLYGGKGDDLLFGGEGNDILEGETGSDTYYFNIGDGQDTIDDYSKKDSTDVDKIIFGKDITLENISMTRDKYDLILQVNESDSIKVKYWFGSDNRNKIEQIEFADHTTLSIDDVKSMIVLEGTDGNNTLKGLDSLDDIIYAFGGKDRLYGYEGDDFLSGGSGKDKLYGAQGDDTLVGGEGDDKLDGYKGSDTYIFNQGDGNDTITDYSKKYSDDIDKIVFGEDTTKDDISFIMKRGDLLIQYGDNDTIKVKDQDSTRNQIELIELSDGNYLTNDDIDLVIQQINSYGQDNGMHHINNNDIQNNADLMNIVSSAWNT